MRCGTRRVFRECGVPRNRGTPRQGGQWIGLPVGFFSPAGWNGRASDRVGV